MENVLSCQCHVSQLKWNLCYPFHQVPVSFSFFSFLSLSLSNLLSLLLCSFYVINVYDYFYELPLNFDWAANLTLISLGTWFTLNSTEPSASPLHLCISSLPPGNKCNLCVARKKEKLYTWLRSVAGFGQSTQKSGGKGRRVAGASLIPHAYILPTCVNKYFLEGVVHFMRVWSFRLGTSYVSFGLSVSANLWSPHAVPPPLLYQFP